MGKVYSLYMKLTILKNNIINQDAFNQGIQTIKDKALLINFPIDLTIKDCLFTFTGVPTPSPTVPNEISVDPYQILAQVDGTDDVVALIYDWNNVSPKSTNPCGTNIKKGNTTPMQLPEEWSGSPIEYPDVMVQFFFHELCHRLFFLTGIHDKTHDQQLDPLWSNKQPIDWFLHLLTGLLPAWNTYKGTQVPIQPKVSSTGLTATITRHYNSNETLGDLVTSTGFSCKTLERPNLGNKQNVSCIPEGQYLCKWVFKLGKFGWVYEIQNVPNRLGILLHSGNFFYDSLGCILLGYNYNDINSDGIIDIINSRQSLADFIKAMNKQTFTLTIKSV